MGVDGAVKQIPIEGAGLSAAGNAEVFAIENMFTERAPLLVKKRFGE